MKPRYWLSPPELDQLRAGRFDVCPYPHAFGDFNALLEEWPKPWYCNPPFHDLTRFVRRAIEIGGPGVMVLPMGPANYELLAAGIRQEPIGRIRWLEVETKKPGGSTLTVKAVFP